MRGGFLQLQLDADFEEEPLAAFYSMLLLIYVFCFGLIRRKQQQHHQFLEFG